MAQDLKSYLAEHACGGFSSVPRYFPGGDFVCYYLRDERCFEERVDDLLTVYRSMDAKELVGCKIKGVRHILQSAGDFGVMVKDGKVRLGLFFFVGASWAKEDSQKRCYEELKRLAQAKDAIVDLKTILPA